MRKRVRVMASSRASLGRSFNGLWFATGSANLADGMALFALPLLALASGASAGGVAAVTMVLTLAWPVFGLQAGWIVDRVDRRTLMSSVNLVRAGVLTVVTIGYATDNLSLPLVLVAAALLGIAETLVDTALTSTVPLVAAPADRTRANARIEATINVANQLAGPPLAGALAGATLALATGASAGLYVTAVAGLAVLALRDNRQPRTGSTRLGSDLVAGLRHVWRQPLIRTLTLFTAAMNLVWGAALALLVVYAVDPGPLGLSPVQYGVMLTAMAAGGLIASILVDSLRRRVGASRLLIADCVGTVLLVAPVAFGGNVWAVAAGVVVAGAGSSVWRILVATIRQNLTAADLLGRVYAASRVISWGALPVGAGLAGLGAEMWGVRAVFGAATVLAISMLTAFVPFAVRNDLSAALVAPADQRTP
ncbi:MAG TPA: MFS transporter [Jiangellaceae bacterium]|nr:MFS transporter [Jiangellaceae bacterium]